MEHDKELIKEQMKAELLRRKKESLAKFKNADPKFEKRMTRL